MRWFFVGLALSLAAPAWAQAPVEVFCDNASGKPLPASPSNPCPVTGTITVTPGTYTPVALNVSTVTTGGTAVSALLPAQHGKGGWIYNPSTATINLCINEQATASGTTSAGALTCLSPGQTPYQVAPNTTSTVSVVSSDSSHPFSGQGYN